MEALHQAVMLGGNAALQQISREQLFQQLAGDPAFQKALQVTPSQESSSTSSTPTESLKSMLNNALSNSGSISLGKAETNEKMHLKKKKKLD